MNESTAAADTDQSLLHIGIDMDWDTLFTAKIKSHIVVTLNVLLTYDRNLIDKLQFRETTPPGTQL